MNYAELDPNVNQVSPFRYLELIPVSASVAGDILVKAHYLHSYPGATSLALGVRYFKRMVGAITLGAGPTNVFRLVEGSQLKDSLTLTRMWLSDSLPRNSESWVLAKMIKELRRCTSLKFLVSYADPARGHLGTIYQASGWLYTGLSSATPLYDLGDGRQRHSRSVAQIMGTHSINYLRSAGLPATQIKQTPKHRYICFLDPTWRSRLKVPILPYPKAIL